MNMRGDTILAFMFLEQIFEASLCVADLRFCWDSIFSFCQTTQDLKILEGKDEVARPSLYCL